MGAFHPKILSWFGKPYFRTIGPLMILHCLLTLRSAMPTRTGRAGKLPLPETFARSLHLTLPGRPPPQCDCRGHRPRTPATVLRGCRKLCYNAPTRQAGRRWTYAWARRSLGHCHSPRAVSVCAHPGYLLVCKSVLRTERSATEDCSWASSTLAEIGDQDRLLDGSSSKTCRAPPIGSPDQASGWQRYSRRSSKKAKLEQILPERSSRSSRQPRRSEQVGNNFSRSQVNLPNRSESSIPTISPGLPQRRNRIVVQPT